MPAFLFVAGIFSKRTVHTNNILKIIKYIPYYLLIKILLYNVRSIIGKPLDFKLFSESQSPWFMLALFIMYIITMLLKEVSPKIVLPSAIFFSLIAGYSPINPQFLVNMRVINFYPFFYLGYSINPNKLLKYTEQKFSKILSWIFILLSFIFVCFNHVSLSRYKLLLSGQNPYSSLKTLSIYGALYRLILFTVSCLMIYAIISIAPTRKMPITEYGQKTLVIYLLHESIMLLLFEKLHLFSIARDYFPTLWPYLLLLTGLLLVPICGVKITLFHTSTP